MARFVDNNTVVLTDNDVDELSEGNTIKMAGSGGHLVITHECDDGEHHWSQYELVPKDEYSMKRQCGRCNKVQTQPVDLRAIFKD